MKMLPFLSPIYRWRNQDRIKRTCTSHAVSVGARVTVWKGRLQSPHFTRLSYAASLNSFATFFHAHSLLTWNRQRHASSSLFFLQIHAPFLSSQANTKLLAPAGLCGLFSHPECPTPPFFCLLPLKASQSSQPPWNSSPPKFSPFTSNRTISPFSILL